MPIKTEEILNLPINTPAHPKKDKIDIVPQLNLFNIEWEETITTFSDYQKQSRKTALYPNNGNNYTYPVLGLCGESGEVAEKIKKVIRDKGGIIDEETRREVKKELGDVLWYLTQIGSELGMTLEDIANENIKKLFSRKNRGKLNGDGDNR